MTACGNSLVGKPQLTISRELKQDCEQPLIPKGSSGPELAVLIILLGEWGLCERDKRRAVLKIVDAFTGK